MTTPGWEGILDDDEQILWQDRPDGRVIWRVGNVMGLLFGLFFAGIALVWMVLAASGGGFFWMFGLIHFFVGLGVAFGSIYWNAIRRRNSWYTLTNKRAFIASQLPLAGKKLKSWPITAGTVLEFRDGDPATIYFANEIRRNGNGTRKVNIGFERIKDGREVYQKLRDVQKSAT